jgi:NADP-dependent 3-hydroxy acid dehydrogenase YdfG
MSDPVFLITGASSGIGAATARAAAQAGHRLVLAARSADKLNALANELGGAERAIAVTCDATIDALRESKGHLLITGSVAGRRQMAGSLYSATKWAVTAMGESARQELNGSGVRVTLIEPGMTDTPFFDNRPKDPLHADDVARAVLWAVSQPPHVDVNEILIRPTAQDG